MRRYGLTLWKQNAHLGDALGDDVLGKETAGRRIVVRAVEAHLIVGGRGDVRILLELIDREVNVAQNARDVLNATLRPIVHVAAIQVDVDADVLISAERGRRIER